MLTYLPKILRFLLILELVPKELVNSFATFDVLCSYYFFFFFDFEIWKLSQARILDVDSLGLSLSNLFKYLWVIVSNLLLLKVHIGPKCMNIFNPCTSTSGQLIHHNQAQTFIYTLSCSLIFKRHMTIIYKWLEAFYTFTWSTLSLWIFESLCLYAAVLRSLHGKPS